MTWAYTPIIGILFAISIVELVIFFFLLFYYLYFIKPFHDYYIATKKMVEAHKGELNTHMLHEAQQSMATPTSTWIYAAMNPPQVETKTQIAALSNNPTSGEQPYP